MKHAVYCGNAAVYDDMEMAAKSLVANSDVGKVWFLTDGEFPRELPGIVEAVDVSGQAFFPWDGPNHGTRYSYMTLMRTALALMPELEGVDKVLSLDADTVCMRDVSGAWDIPVEGCYFAASQERWALSRPGLRYCNTGVALYNLAQLRDGKAREVVDALNRQWFSWPDQDAMNYLCQGRIADMPSEYNSCPWTVDSADAIRIVHFAARDDWRSELVASKYRAMGWDEALRRHRG